MPDYALNTPPFKIISKNFFYQNGSISQYVQLKLAKKYIFDQESST